MTIPYAAMQYRYGVYRAFAVEGDRLEARELKTGDRVGDRMEILDGLNTADRVAVTEVDTLTDGMKIASRRLGCPSSYYRPLRSHPSALARRGPRGCRGR